MILFTKDVFLKLKTCNAVYVQVQQNTDYSQTPPRVSDSWQVMINGQVEFSPTSYDSFVCAVACSSREEAYRVYKDLAQQIVDSGCVPELTNDLIDNVLKEK